MGVVRGLVRGGGTRRGPAAAALLLWAALASSVVCSGALVGCGGDDDGGTSPASLRSQLLPASAVPGFKTEGKFDWDTPTDFVRQGLKHVPESTPFSRVVDTFENAGFEAGVVESFVAAKGSPVKGPHVLVDVVQLGSDDNAREALDYVLKEALKQPCVGVCSVTTRRFAVTGISGAKGVQLTPLRNPPPDAPDPFVAYDIGFTSGPRLYLVSADGGPGQVKKSQILSAAKALYKRTAKSDAAS